MENQLALFGIFGLIGLAAGFLYDGLRLIRRRVPHNLVWLSLEDVVFWLALSGIALVVFIHRSSGQLRGYALVGLAAGGFLYEGVLGPRLVGRWLPKVRPRRRKKKKKTKMAQKPIDE